MAEAGAVAAMDPRIKSEGDRGEGDRGEGDKAEEAGTT